MEARHQTRAVCRATQAMARERGDEAAQDAAREEEVVPEGVWGRGRGATPRATRGRGCRRANNAALNLAPVGQPQDQQDLVALVVALQQRLEAQEGEM